MYVAIKYIMYVCTYVSLDALLSVYVKYTVQFKFKLGCKYILYIAQTSLMLYLPLDSLLELQLYFMCTW